VIAWKEIAAGALTFAVAHVIEVETWPWFDPSAGSPPWFLNAGRAVVLTAVSLIFAGAVAGVWPSATNRGAIARGCSIGAGAILAMAVVLFARGPGTLFPIALVLGAAIVLASSISGTLLGSALGGARRVRRA
jgi:hypothetical protein